MNNLTTTNQRSLSQQAKKQTFTAFIGQQAIVNKINSIVGGKDGQRFITSIVSAVSTNTALAECNHSTILSCALLGESLKLSPSPQLGHYYMVPFKKKANPKTGEGASVSATFVLGYKGYVQLAIRSGYYKKINVLPIKEGELISYNPLDEEIEVNLIVNELEREKAPTVGYYAMFEYVSGFKKAMYWSKEKMLLHADQYSQAFSADSYAKLMAGEIPESDMWKYSSFWYKDFDGMACKTMLRQLISKWGIMSIEMQSAFDADERIIGDNLQPDEFVSNDDIQSEVETIEATADKIEAIAEVETKTANEEDYEDPFADIK